ncbi:MAG: hypothetical protein EBZ48_16155 [Proteobacteria bacterium]|nr:hypothetical protein [Pseudomonadota bacterium]
MAEGANLWRKEFEKSGQLLSDQIIATAHLSLGLYKLLPINESAQTIDRMGLIAGDLLAWRKVPIAPVKQGNTGTALKF